MKRKQGFTLIELLAIIVILAIIALIAVPVVLNIIDKARISSNARSSENILEAARLYYHEYQLDKTTDIEGNQYETIKSTLSGNTPDDGKIYIQEDGDIALALTYGDYCYHKGYKDVKINYDKMSEADKAEDGIGCTYEFNYLKDGVNETDKFLGGGNDRSTYTRVVIKDTLADVGDNAWDVSARENGSIMAWSDGTTLYIAQEGGVVVSPNIEYAENGTASKGGSFLFANFTNVENMDLSKLDTSLVTNMGGMFYNSPSATTSKEVVLDLSGWDTTNVERTTTLFASSGASTIVLSGWDTQNVNDMRGMFQNCSKLTEIIGINSLDTSNVENMSYVFYLAKSLPELDLSNFDTSKVTNIAGIFRQIGTKTEGTKILFNNAILSSFSAMSATEIRAAAEAMFNESNISEITLKRETYNLLFAKLNSSGITEENGKAIVLD